MASEEEEEFAEDFGGCAPPPLLLSQISNQGLSSGSACHECQVPCMRSMHACMHALYHEISDMGPGPAQDLVILAAEHPVPGFCTCKHADVDYRKLLGYHACHACRPRDPLLQDFQARLHLPHGFAT